MRLVQIVILLVCTSLQHTFAQTNDVCKAYIQDYMEQMIAYSENQGKQIFYMHVNTNLIPNQESKYANLELSPKDVELKIYSGEGKMYYESKYLAIYQDKKEVFTVIHPQKLIIWSQEGNNEANQSYKQSLISNLTVLQRKLIKMSSVLSCRDVDWSGKLVKKIELLPSQAARKEFHIKKLIYYYNPLTKQVLKQIIEYTPEHKLKKQIVTYYTMIMDYKGKIPKEARSFVFAQENQMLNKYKSYQLERR